MVHAAKRKVDILIGKSILTSEAIARELRGRLAREISTGREQGRSALAILETARNILWEFEPALAHNVADSQLAAWIVGADDVSNKIPKRLITQLTGGVDEPPGAIIIGETAKKRFSRLRLPVIAEAIKDLHARRIVTRSRFDQLDDALKRSAFTIARIDSESTIGKIRDILEQDIARGTSLRSFRKSVEEELGHTPIGDAHLENVYRTNTQALFSGGQQSVARHPIVKSAFPFAVISPIDDGRVRETHLSLETSGLNGTAYYWADDPMWHIFTPPMDYQCRCHKSVASVDQAARNGVKVAQQWLTTGVEPHHESMLGGITWRPTPGFVGGARFVV